MIIFISFIHIYFYIKPNRPVCLCLIWKWTDASLGCCKNVNTAVLFHRGISLFARLCSDTYYHYKTCTIRDSPCCQCRLWMCAHRLRWSLLSIKSSSDHRRLPQLHTQPWICCFDHNGNITSHWGQKHKVSVSVCTIQSLGIGFHSWGWIWIYIFVLVLSQCSKKFPTDFFSSLFWM